MLNRGRYDGSPGESDAAASESFSFMRLDVRDRIDRRLLLAPPVRGPRRPLGLSIRKVTRTGLLEHDDRRHLHRIPNPT